MIYCGGHPGTASSHCGADACKVKDAVDFMLQWVRSVSSNNGNDMLQATDAARTQQLDFIESALQKASSLPGWTVLMGHHPAFSGDESYFIEDDTGLPESSAWARVSTADHCICRGQGFKLE